MRFFLTAILLALFVTAWTGEAKLTPGAEAALTKYEQDAAKAKSEMDTKVAAAREAVTKVLTAEMEKLTKAGKLDDAIAIRSKIAELTKPTAPPADGTGAPVVTVQEAPVDITEPDLLNTPTNRIPAGIKWAPYNTKKGIASALKLGAFPVDTPVKPILSYISAGDFKKGYMGVSFEKQVVDGQGNLNCDEQDNSDTYWVVYLKAAKESINMVIVAKANPADHTNSSDVYLDGVKVKPGVNSTISDKGHILILHQKHKAAYRDASIRFLSEGQFLVGSP